MHVLQWRISVWLMVAGIVLALPAGIAHAAEPVAFNRDIRPILSSQCFQCHGPDQNNRKGGLRLDVREKALLPAESGEIAIVPGKPETSELVRRVFAENSGETMPPPKSNKTLTAAQKELLRRWVAEGAEYQPHWSLIPPQRRDLPPVKQTAWPRNPIDQFILARLEREGLQPSPEADRATLFRRLSLDLTGLPPKPDDVTAFEREMTAATAQDQGTPGADDAQAQRQTEAVDRVYENWVNKLLASPHYGERMAVDWLDAARFADTNGYQVDRDREMYAWRDWVIEAFNSNKPFDQFTIEQIAGDLLPGATLQQKTATGFHRNHMLNEEGGIIPEEFLAEYCADRVETTATVWLGQTFNCCRCHDHKFDPFTQRDYYGLYAFFHNVTEGGIGNYGANIRRNAPPILKLPAPDVETKLGSLNQELAEVRKRLAETDATIAAGQAEWEGRLRQSPVVWRPAVPTLVRIMDADVALDAERTAIHIPAFDPGTHAAVVEARLPLSRVTALRLECVPLASGSGAEGKAATPMTFQLGQLRMFRSDTKPVEKEPLAVQAAETENSLPAIEVAKALEAGGKTRTAVSVKDDAGAALVFELDAALSAEMPIVHLELSILVGEKTTPWEFRLLATDAATDLLAPATIVNIVRKEAATLTPEEENQIAGFRTAKHRDRRLLAERVAAQTRQIDETDLQIPTTLVMEEMAASRAHIHFDARRL